MTFRDIIISNDKGNTITLISNDLQLTTIDVSRCRNKFKKKKEEKIHKKYIYISDIKLYCICKYIIRYSSNLSTRKDV